MAHFGFRIWGVGLRGCRVEAAQGIGLGRSWM